MNCGYGEKLILYFYGEAGAGSRSSGQYSSSAIPLSGDETASAVEAHLKSCAACRDAFAALTAAEGLLKESAALPPASALEAVMRDRKSVV